MYVNNTAILELRIFSGDNTLDYRFLLQLLNTFTVVTFILRFVLTNDILCCRLVHLPWTFKNDLVLYIIGSD